MAPALTIDDHDIVVTQSDVQDRYTISPITLFAPENRKLKISMIGAGVSGIMMAYRVQKDLENVEFVTYEKNADIGGTWLLNRYPGCACDVPSHAYTYNFALNPDWPRFFSPSEEIWSYLDRVVEKFDLRKYMKFSSEVVKCEWQESSSTWKILIRQTDSTGLVTEIMDECDILLHATGVLNNFKWPTIKGIEKFKGKMIHTARWPKEYQKEDWVNERVAVIGSGASSIQTVPTMQPHVKHMEVFIRTPVWFVDIAGNEGNNAEYTPEQKESFRSDPKVLVEHAKSLEGKMNSGFAMMLKGTPEQVDARRKFTERTAGMIKDSKLLEGLIPKWSVGCRRVTPGDPYMSAIQQTNVEVNFTEVVEITETTIIGKNGVEKEVDTVICATGYDTSFKPVFPIIGRNGVSLADKWAKVPQSYLGLAIPDMPNFLTFIGPSWPIANGSVMGPLEAVGEYAIQFVKKMQNELIKSMEPKKEVADMFNEHVQEFMKGTVWTDDCSSWYKDSTGRINAVWPGASLHFIETIKTPRFEDYNITYSIRNRFQYLGQGYTRDSLSDKGDKSPYISIDAIDKAWL